MRTYILVVIFTAAGAASGQKHTAITNVTVIDVIKGGTINNATVVIAGDKIETVTTEPIAFLKKTKRIDGTGKFLIPGLWDMHTHFTQDPSSLDLFLAHGVTGVRDMGAIAVRRTGKSVEYIPREAAIRSVIRARDEIRSGKRLGPQIFTAGIIVTGPDPRKPNAPAFPHQMVVKNPAEARSVVRRLKKAGVDFIKVHARLTPDCFDAITAEARKVGLDVVGHVPTSIDPIRASRAGQRSIEHLTGEWEFAHKGYPDDYDNYDRKVFETEIAEFRKNKTWQVPTLVNFLAPAEAYRIVRDLDSEPALMYVVPELGLRWAKEWAKSAFTAQIRKGFLDSVSTLQEMTLELHKGGVGILAGTDSGGIFTYPGISLHKELELLNAGGLTPLQTLQTATIRPAEFLGISHRTGSVTEGKSADLVILNYNPLLNTLHTASISDVFVRGRHLDRHTLNAMLEEVKKRAQPTRALLKRAWK